MLLEVVKNKVIELHTQLLRTIIVKFYVSIFVLLLPQVQIDDVNVPHYIFYYIEAILVVGIIV